MLYDGDGHVTSNNTYLLQGNIIKFPAWLTVVGFHAGYKLS